MKAVISHTLKVYETLRKNASIEEINGEPILIFRGKVTEVYRSSGISQGYYTEIFRQLEAQQCISFLQRGSRSVESVIVLHDPPTEDGYSPPPKSDLTDPERYANLREDVEALQTLVGGIHIALALRQIDERLARIEAQFITVEEKV